MHSINTSIELIDPNYGAYDTEVEIDFNYTSGEPASSPDGPGGPPLEPSTEGEVEVLEVTLIDHDHPTTVDPAELIQAVLDQCMEEMRERGAER